MNIEKYIDIKEDVAEAIRAGKAVVALESTIISHGMPYPQNLEMSKNCERIIRDKGAVPATTAIIGGRIKIGLEDADLELLAKSKDVRKVSRRDFAACVADKAHGATTVASTLIISKMAGIKVFATGGIGGVHRGFKDVMDVSADLEELSISSTCVVCAGAKSILDIPKTLEYLETKGVPVAVYKSDEFPAFFVRTSGCKAHKRVDDLKNFAESMKIKEDLGLTGGHVLANPIPEEAELDKAKIDAAIDAALKAADAEGISGKDATPFLLKYVVEATEGKSLEANIALVYNNCALAAELAVEYSKL